MEVSGGGRWSVVSGRWLSVVGSQLSAHYSVLSNWRDRELVIGAGISTDKNLKRRVKNLCHPWLLCFRGMLAVSLSI